MKEYLKRRSPLFLVIISLFCSLLFFFICYRYDNKYTGNSVQPINGILFLEQEELNRYPVHFLVNEWSAYHNVLLSPEDFHNKQAPVPDSYMQIGTGPHTVRAGSTTYSLLLVLPPSPAAYTLEIPEIYSSYSLYVNDALLVSQSVQQSGNYRDPLQTGSITFTAWGDTRILIAVENNSYYYSGILSPPAFGKPIHVASLLNRQLVFHTLIVAIAGFQALFFFLPGIYSLRPQRYLFAALCLLFIGYAYHNVKGIFPSPLFLSASIELFCYYGMILFVLLLASRLCAIRFLCMEPALLAGGCICILAICIPYLGKYVYVISDALNLYKIIMAAVLLVYAAAAACHGNVNHKILLAGISIFSASLMADQLWPLFEPVYLGWFPEIAGACFILILGAVLLMDAQHLQHQQLVLEEQHIVYKQQIARQEQHYETLVGQIEHARRARHDLRHHIIALDQMLRDNQVREAREYLGQYEGSLNLSEKMIFSNHYKVDVIIRYFYTLARENGISVTINASLPQTLHIAETDLCIIFGNLLENALESCLKSREEDPFIRLDTVLSRSQIIISMENTMSGHPIPCNDGFLSTKKTGRKGIGLSSIQNIAFIYGGSVRFEAAGPGTFFNQVLLINQDTI